MTKKNILLSTTYLGPVQYYSKLVSYDNILIEKHENYSKQSYRNRCNILGGNGLLTLTIPANKTGNNTPISDIKPEYDQEWQKLHWKSIVSAYNNSPFFEYYKDDFYPFFHSCKWKYLIDFNTALQDMILDLLEVETEIKQTEEFIKTAGKEFDDYRFSIHPKRQRTEPDPHFVAAEYTQVFHDKMGFHPNLSIIDLIFNEGPNALTILENSFIK
jgi:hypothetical protein